MHLAERLMRWKFTIQHIVGAKNYAPDVLSRSPTQGSSDERELSRSGTSSCPDYTGHNITINAISQNDQESSDSLEAQVLATTINTKLLLTSWQDLKTAGIADEEYSLLLNTVNSDLGRNSWPQDINEYKKFSNDLTSIDGVVTFKGRTVVSLTLRHKILKALHQSHQGVSGMSLRSSASVWWPNIGKDIENMRASCLTCHRNAPRQQPVSPPLPEHPFQLVSSDYCQFEGQVYLVMVDRYSNWPTV